jgi:protein-disulfide isomerase
MSQLLLDRPRLTVEISERDHIRGPITAPLTLLEYGDYECPFCAAAHPNIKQVLSELGDQLAFAYRHFPLTTIHPHAFTAAEAAEAAGAQGRFWEMHDLLFENQDRLSMDDLLVYAQLLGLSMDRFVADLQRHTYEPRVREDFMTGVRSGVNGTPTFFVNGVRHNGGVDANSLLEALAASA